MGSSTADGSTTGYKDVAVSATVAPGIYWAVTQTGGAGGCATSRPKLDYAFKFGDNGGSIGGLAFISASRTDAALPSSLAGTSWGYKDSNGNIPHGLNVKAA